MLTTAEVAISSWASPSSWLGFPETARQEDSFLWASSGVF